MSDTMDIVGRTAFLAGTEAVDRLLKSLLEQEDRTLSDDAEILSDALRRLATPELAKSFHTELPARSHTPTSFVMAFARALTKVATDNQLDENQIKDLFHDLVGLVEKPAKAAQLVGDARDSSIDVVQAWFDGLLTNYTPSHHQWG